MPRAGPTTIAFVRGSLRSAYSGPGRSDPEAAPLAGREAPEAGVAAELAAVLVDDRPVGGAEPVALEEVAVVAAGEEARLLALRPGGSLEPGPRGLGARLVLALLAEREPDPVEEARVEAREHVRLVLRRIGRARKQPAASCSTMRA